MLFGKTVSELQSGIVIADGEITGTLKHVTGYTGFSSVSEDQEGHYLALKIEDEPEGAVTTVEVVNGDKGPVTLDEDRNIVLLIRDNEVQSIEVVTTYDDETITQEYGLSGLTMEE